MALLLPLAACVPSEDPEPGIGDEGETGGAGEADGSNGEEEASGGEQETTDGEESGDESSCEQPSGASFDVDSAVLDGLFGSVEWSCEVSESTPGSGLHVVLDCADAAEPVVLDVDSSPSFSFDEPIAVGETLELSFARGGCFSCDTGDGTTLRLDRGGEHLLSRVRAVEYPLEGAPVAMQQASEASEPCAPEPSECGDRYRQAVELSANGESLALFDGHSGAVGETKVWVDESWRLDEPGCFHVTIEFFDVLVVDGAS